MHMSFTWSLVHIWGFYVDCDLCGTPNPAMSLPPFQGQSNKNHIYNLHDVNRNPWRLERSTVACCAHETKYDASSMSLHLKPVWNWFILHHGSMWSQNSIRWRKHMSLFLWAPRQHISRDASRMIDALRLCSWGSLRFGALFLGEILYWKSSFA